MPKDFNPFRDEHFLRDFFKLPQRLRDRVGRRRRANEIRVTLTDKHLADLNSGMSVRFETGLVGVEIRRHTDRSGPSAS